MFFDGEYESLKSVLFLIFDKMILRLRIFHFLLGFRSWILPILLTNRENIFRRSAVSCEACCALRSLSEEWRPPAIRLRSFQPSPVRLRRTGLCDRQILCRKINVNSKFHNCLVRRSLTGEGWKRRSARRA
jgi:hypothetical protein